MAVNERIFRELLKRGYSEQGKIRVWDISDSKLWYFTPELSKSFLKLERYRPYKKNFIDREINLIKSNINQILKMLSEKRFNLIDLGSGNGEKAEVFIKSLPNDARLRYCPVDISPQFVKLTMSRIRRMNSSKVMATKQFTENFRNLDNIVGLVLSGQYPRNICLLLGATLSHYDINDLLFTISNGMFKGDVLVIGNGIRKGKRFVELEKYKVHFFDEWFINIMKGLGFSEEELKYDARFANKRLEALYKILVDKEINYAGRSVKFSKGDEVIVAVQYKYFPAELEKFCKMYFSSVEIIKDKDEEYCLVLCKK